MLQPELIDKVVERFTALADPSRIRLLHRLKEAEANVTALAEELGMNQASASKHLAILKSVGLVQVRRQGQQAIYSIHDQSVFDLCQVVCDGVIRHLRQEHAALGLDQSPKAVGKRPKKSPAAATGNPA